MENFIITFRLMILLCNLKKEMSDLSQFLVLIINLIFEVFKNDVLK